MGAVKKAEVKFEELLRDGNFSEAFYHVIKYSLTQGGYTSDDAVKFVEETKKAFMKIYE